MKIWKKLIIGAAIVLLVAATAGLTALAVNTYGSQSDPLVTLSYLDETVMNRLREEMGGLAELKSYELQERLEELLDEYSGDQGLQVDEDLRFSVVTLSNGQTVTCSVGTEIMLRVGTAVSYGPDNPRLIDETTGNPVSSSGSSLTTNHMYIVTIEGNGIKATKNNTKVLIRGEYTVE